MEIGLYTVLTDETMLPGEAAKLIEDAGFDAIRLASTVTSRRVARRRIRVHGELPQGYVRTLDLFVVLNAAALATTHAADGVVDHPDRSARPDHDREGGRQRRLTCPTAGST